MIQAPHFSAAGARKASAFALPEPYFDGTVHEGVLHQAVKTYLANQRQGTHATKTRSFVSGGNQKPWKQKGTGRARQGSIRAPHWRGGGIVFGPQPRDYTMALPRKVKQLARRSALNARASEGQLFVVERFDFTSPRTARLVELLEALGVADRKTLILTHGVSEALYLSGRNLQNVEVLPYSEATPYDILWANTVIVEEGALNGEPAVPFVRPMVKEPKPAPSEVPARAAKAKPAKKEKAAAPKAEAKKTEKPKAAAPKKAKAAKKPAAKKAAPKAARKPASGAKGANKKKGGK